MKGLATIPVVKIELDGKLLDSSTLGTLQEVTIRSELSQPTRCEVRFVSPLAGFLPSMGVPFRVVIEEGKEELFDGSIAAVEYVRMPSGERSIFVRAYDALQQLRRRHSVRAYTDATARSLAEDMTSALGLTVSSDTEGPEWRTLIQHNKTDLDFLRSIALRSGLYFTLRGSVLHLLALDGLEEEVELELGQTLFEAAVEANSVFSSGPVTTAAWDPLRVEHHEGRAVTPRSSLKNPGSNASSQEGMTVALANQTATDDRQAEALAQAELDLREAGTWILSGTAEGNQKLQPGTRVKVSGYPSDFPDEYVLTSVTHRIGRGTGFISEVSSRPPAEGPSPEGTILAWGLVIDIQDPDHMGRVRLSLPAVGDVHTDWLEVLAIGAGKGKGFVSLPDVGDKVVALFAREDFSTGMVVGSLFGTDGLDDYGVDQKIVRFALLTPGGHKLHFDDTKQSIRLEDKTGNYVELAPEKMSLHSATDLEIAAPGKTMTIAANNINFRRL